MSRAGGPRVRPTDPPGDPFVAPVALTADAHLAARLLAADSGLGGIVLRASPGPARDAWLAAHVAALPPTTVLRRLPVAIDDDRLLGGVDLAATLAAGRPVTAAGLLAEAAGGTIVVPMAERIAPALAGRLAAAMDRGDVRFVFLDEGEGDESVPAALTDRAGLWLTLDPAGELQVADRGAPVGVDAALDAVCSLAARFGVASPRAALLALRAARGCATLAGDTVHEGDVAAAVRLVLLPRATRFEPAPETAADAAEPEASDTAPTDDAPGDAATLADRLVDAAAAWLPADLLSGLAERAPACARDAGHGAVRPSAGRGRPLPSRPGRRVAGARLALIDTLRAAVPWQRLRPHRPGIAVAVRAADFRWRRFADRTGQTTIIAVDASGSAAAARLAEAKGAAELLLARAYVDRAEVAIVAFRGQAAEVVVPPSRSLVRARRGLADLCGGGGTPLAAGLDLAAAVIRAVQARGRQASLVVLTDGRANIARAGTAVRAAATADAHAAARVIAAMGVAAVVVDTSARPRREGAELAGAMAARYLPLPAAGAAATAGAVAALLPT